MTGEMGETGPQGDTGRRPTGTQGATGSQGTQRPRKETLVRLAPFGLTIYGHTGSFYIMTGLVPTCQVCTGVTGATGNNNTIIGNGLDCRHLVELRRYYSQSCVLDHLICVHRYLGRQYG